MDAVFDCIDCAEIIDVVSSTATLIFPHTGEYRLGVRIPVTWLRTGGSDGSYTLTVNSVESGEIGRHVADLSDAHPEVRRAVAQNLLEMGPDAAPALSALIRALDDPDLVVVYYAS